MLDLLLASKWIQLVDSLLALPSRNRREVEVPKHERSGHILASHPAAPGSNLRAV